MDLKMTISLVARFQSPNKVGAIRDIRGILIKTYEWGINPANENRLTRLFSLLACRLTGGLTQRLAGGLT